MSLLLWVDLFRVIFTGLVLGLLVGKLVARNPSHLNRLRPSSWRTAMRKMRRRHWVRLLTIALWVAAASLIISSVVGTLLQQAEVQTYSPAEYPFTAIERDYPWLLLIAVNTLPIFEEWIFRGVMVDELVRWRGSKSLAVIISTLVFAVFHLSNPGTYPAFVLPLIPAGLLLGACYLYTGLGGAIIAHNSYNTFLVFIAVFVR